MSRGLTVRIKQQKLYGDLRISLEIVLDVKDIQKRLPTFVFLVRSRQQRVEDVVVSFSGVLSHNSILERNKCKNMLLY